MVCGLCPFGMFGLLWICFGMVCSADGFVFGVLFWDGLVPVVFVLGWICFGMVCFAIVLFPTLLVGVVRI